MTAEIRHQIHMQEVEKKIKLMRMNWFIKNYETTAKNPNKPKDAMSSKMAELVDEIQEMRAETKDMYAKLEKYQMEINAKDSGKSDDADSPARVLTKSESISYMYPMPADVKLQLYTGISGNREGRYRYLKTRNALTPDEKYRSCPTNNYNYGWKIKTQTTLTKPKHGKKQVLKTTMYRVNGITLYEEHPTQRPPNPPGHLEFASL